MRILFADKFQAANFDELVAAGHDCALKPELGADELVGAVAGFEALVVRSTEVAAETMGGADALRLIVRAGAGVNTIDVEAATAAGIRVCNTPGKNSIAVAELTMGLLIGVDRRIPDNVADLRAGKWNKSKYQTAAGLHGRDIGIVGLGGIGMAVARRAAAFGLNLHAYARPNRSDAQLEEMAALGFIIHPDLPTMAGSVDIVTIHVPAAASTKNLIDAEFLSHLKPGAILLNTSRGDAVDEEALLAALDGDRLRAGLDVYQDEPASGTAQWTSRLAQHRNVYGTHHIGSSTDQSQNAIGAEVVRVIEAFASGEVVNCVNPEAA